MNALRNHYFLNQKRGHAALDHAVFLQENDDEITNNINGGTRQSISA
jgi:hypothetical protein